MAPLCRSSARVLGTPVIGKLASCFSLRQPLDDRHHQAAGDAGIGDFSTDDEGFGEFPVREAPAIEGADAHPEILGDFMIGSAEVAEVAGLIGVGGVVEHGAG